MFNHLGTLEKIYCDIASVLALIGVFLHWLPQATAFLSFVWVLLRLWESPTIQGFVARLRKRP